MKKHILITASTFPRFEGDTTPSFVFEYSKRLSKYYKILVLCPHAKGLKKHEYIEGIEIYRYRYFGDLAYDGGITAKLKQSKIKYLQIPLFLFFQLLSIIKLAKKYDIEIIHAHWLIPQGLVATIYKRLFNKKIKIISTGHGADIYGLRSKPASYLKRLVIENSDQITCVSNALKQEILRLYERKDIHVIPMGIDTEKFLPEKMPPSNGQTLLFVGRLVEKKGVYYLIQAIPKIQKKFSEAKLLIIGDGPENESLMSQAKNLNISFLGAIPHEHLPQYFAKADVFIGPSITASDGDSEGFGLVFAEALSCETPVISTKLPAITDIVQDNINGFLVEEKNPNAIAEKTILMLENLEEAKRMGKKGRKHVVDNFDWKIITERYKEKISEMFAH